MCCSSGSRCARGEFEFWWVDSAERDADGDLCAVEHPYLLTAGNDAAVLADQAQAWARWAQFEFGPGVLVMTNSAGEVLVLEHAAA